MQRRLRPSWFVGRRALRISFLFLALALIAQASHAAECGDFILDVGEQCDDGNTSSGDGCSATCEAEPAPIAYGDSLIAIINPPGEVHAYAFTGASGDPAILRMTTLGGTLDPQIRVFGPGGVTPLCADALAAPGTLEVSCLLDADGAHTVLVEDNGGNETGSYDITLQRLAEPVGATPIAYGDTLSRTIGQRGELDVYVFTGASGDPAILRVATTGGALDPQIRVFRPDGLTLLCGDALAAPGTLEVSCLLDTDGAHTVLIEDNGSNELGAYDITLQRLAEPVGATPIAYGDTLSRTIGQRGELDVYVFTGASGEQAIVRMTSIGGALDPQIRVFRPDGLTLLCGDALAVPGTLEVSCLLDTDGAYTVLIEDNGGTEVGAYNIGLDGIPEPMISMSFDGLVRDRVGAGNAALGADTHMDGVFTVMLEAGSEDRVVTSLQVTRSGGGQWDTDPATRKWIAGAASSLDEALLNDSDGSVNFELLDGTGFKMFLSDAEVPLFSIGQAFTLEVGFADGSSAVTNLTIDEAVVTPDPDHPIVTMTYNGLLRDRVGAGNAAVSPDGSPDGVFMVVLETGSGDKTVTSLAVARDSGGRWDADSATRTWIAGAAYSLDEPLLNNGDASVDFDLMEGDSFKIFVSDVTPSLFTAGQTIQLNVGFADGSSATTSVMLEDMLPSDDEPIVSMTYDGLLRDKVGPGNLALDADGSMDGVFMVVLEPGSGNKTVTLLRVTRSGGGIWDSDGATRAWIAGAAYSLDEPLLNNGDASVDFDLMEGDSFKIFVSDVTPSLFTAGQTIQLNVGFADGSSATTSVVLE